MSQLRKYNQKSEDVLGHISACLEANSRYYRSVQVRCVSVAHDGEWSNVLCFARVHQTEVPTSVSGSRPYRSVHLLEEWDDVSRVTQLLREMPTGKIIVDGETISVGDRSEFHEWEQLPSRNEYADFPGYLYGSSTSSPISGQPALLQTPLLDFTLPHYPDVYEAIRDWIGLRTFHGQSDARIGYLYLFLPECRAVLDKFEVSGTHLKVAIAPGAYDSDREFRLNGSWTMPQRVAHISSPILNTALSAEIEIPSDATGVELYLMDRTGAIFDYHQEAPSWNRGQHRILPPSTEEASDDLLELAQPSYIVGIPQTSSAARNPGQALAPAGNKVFLVHGRNEGIKQTVARFIEKLGLEVVILHEQPNRGRTLIEKFEDYSSVGFAVVLLTADDVGRPAPTGASKRKLSPRARQNVIFEFGYFVGKLGRGRTCALLENGVEKPSDIDGIVYVPLGEGEGWKPALAKELKNAGYSIDLDKAL